MKKFFDLSHAIREQPNCSFEVINKLPEIRYLEGGAQGSFFITTKINNLFFNISTHIDFPGHLPELRGKFSDSVGAYAIERFVGSVLVLDFSSKLQKIKSFFDDKGKFLVDLKDEEKMMLFLKALEKLEISTSEFNEVLKICSASLSSLKGILLYTGLSAYWKYEINDAWNFIYFFNPFLSSEVCEQIACYNFSFIGVDTSQIEHPIVNYNGDETPLVSNPKCREFVIEKLNAINGRLNHKILLEKDILIYENVNIPPEVANCVVDFSGVPLNFQIEGMNNNALARPYAVLVS